MGLWQTNDKVNGILITLIDGFYLLAFHNFFDGKLEIQIYI